jgi:ADA HAT complex component 1
VVAPHRRVATGPEIATRPVTPGSPSTIAATDDSVRSRFSASPPMQSMFRMWSSEPVVDLPFLNKLKRKSTDSPEPTSPRSQQSLKKWKLEHGEMAAFAQVAEVHPDPHRNMGSLYTPPDSGVPLHGSDALDAIVTDGPVALQGRSELVASTDGCRNAQPVVEATLPEQITPANTECDAAETPALEDVIEAQFNYEILLKHEELRLIEVELAKCQTALEQLRRCQLIPFPGAAGMSEDVSNGAGPALAPAPGYSRPQQPAPWGVTDGPYTRHFSKWLIQDSYFDPEAATWRPVRTRQTRAVPVEHSPAPTPVDAPTVRRARLLRKADNKVVDLHCDTCQMSSFGNVQGFLNHMRIKHSMHYKDHEAAAVSCGRPVEGEDANLPVATPTATKASATTRAMGGKKPVPSKTMSTTRTAAAAQKTPLVTSGIKPSPLMTPTPTSGNLAQAMMRTDYFATLPPKPVNRPIKAPEKKKPTPRDNVPASTAPRSSEVPLNPSAQTPHLSALMQRRGLGGDLAKLIEETKRPVDINLSNSSSDDEDSSPSPVPGGSPANDVSAARVPTAQNGASRKALGSSENATGHLGTSENPRKRKLEPVRVPEVQRQGHGPPAFGMATPDGHTSFTHESSELSPHTVESNPGLVSDHEDDDEDDDARSVAAPSLLREFDDMDVEVEDGSDLESRKGLASFKASSSKGGKK